MITGFEDKTFKLTPNEQDVILPILVTALNHMVPGPQNKRSSTYMMERLEKIGHKVSPVRLRKMIQYIRFNDMVSGVCSDSQGYWIASSKEDYIATLTSLRDRISHQTATFNALKRQYIKTYGVPKDKNKKLI